MLVAVPAAVAMVKGPVVAPAGTVATTWVSVSETIDSSGQRDDRRRLTRTAVRPGSISG
jgi:hypothetical protein